MAQWYVMYTKPRQEAVAQDNLQRQNYRVFFPKARVKKRKAGQACEVVEPLFPRYIFVHLEVGVDNFSKLRSTKGCIDLVKFGGKASPVPAELIDLIQCQLEDDGAIDLRRVAEPPEVGASVRVSEGPFEGLIGTIAKHKGADRVLLLLNVLGGERMVQLQASQLERRG